MGKKERIAILRSDTNVVETAERGFVASALGAKLTAEVFVFVDGKIVIQKMMKKESWHLGQLSLLGETLRFNESFEKAAVSGVKEELGLKVRRLVAVGEKTFIAVKPPSSNLYIQTFVCEGSGKLKIDPQEVESCRIMSLNELKQLVENKPEECSAALKRCFKIVQLSKWRGKRVFFPRVLNFVRKRRAPFNKKPVKLR